MPGGIIGGMIGLQAHRQGALRPRCCERRVITSHLRATAIRSWLRISLDTAATISGVSPGATWARAVVSAASFSNHRAVRPPSGGKWAQTPAIVGVYDEPCHLIRFVRNDGVGEECGKRQVGEAHSGRPLALPCCAPRRRPGHRRSVPVRRPPTGFSSPQMCGGCPLMWLCTSLLVPSTVKLRFMTTLSYHIVNVFTQGDDPFSGNPLCVVENGEFARHGQNAGAGAAVQRVRDRVSIAIPARQRAGAYFYPALRNAVCGPSHAWNSAHVQGSGSRGGQPYARDAGGHYSRCRRRAVVGRCRQTPRIGARCLSRVRRLPA